MSTDYIERPEFNESIGRIHDRVEDIKERTIRIEESSERIEKFGDRIDKLMFGNGRPGLIERVGKLFAHIKTQYFLIGTILIAIISGAVAVWMKK